ncbi:MAG: NAD-dependent epimerase/dehydratase family protein [Clostridia bacterium]|nr:NAD-dependent epimerase/dehydratase family protein [Clostridia bacterium]
MELYTNKLYQEDLEAVASLVLPWEKLNGKRILLSGASGLIGSCLVDVLMTHCRMAKTDQTIYALGRNPEKLYARFSAWRDDPRLRFVTQDINTPMTDDVPMDADLILHLASNTHPIQYATDPVGTIMTNVIGLKNMLDLAVRSGTRRFLFASSNEIYGENRGDIECFHEGYLGYIDCNTLRAGYPESKRCGEALCQAYRRQYGLDVVIPRFTRSYGPTMIQTDSKAISQFIKKAVAGEEIILKSAGTQYYSYTYVMDAVSGLLTVLLCGEDGAAYNIADAGSDIMLKDVAQILAEEAGTHVVFELPDAVEAAGYSKATKARLDGSKIKMIGWKPRFEIREGLQRTVRILRDM